MTITLRPQQIAGADAVEAAFREGVKRPLADMCVGSGKSLLFAELARREIERGGRALILSHTRELVAQNASACRMLGLSTGVNAAALRERTWRAPVISAAIQSVYRNANAFGPVNLIGVDESHLLNHSQNGMYHEFLRGFPHARVAGASGTVFRLQGGSLVEGEGAPFDKVVFRYTIVDGIRDGYLVPAYSVGAQDKVDPSKLRTKAGEFTAESSDAQMIEAMDNHIAQMVAAGDKCRAWLVFEASAKSAKAMAERMNQWGIPTGLVLGESGASDRSGAVEAYRHGRLRAMVNINALSIGFDVPHVDMLVFRRPTKSLGLYIQQAGRGLRTIGGNIEASVAAGKSDCVVLDFAGNIDRHGPLDFIRPRETKSRLVSCDECGTRNAAAAARCWKCDAVMTKSCPACLVPVPKGTLDCPHCQFDMRAERSEPKEAKLFDVPSGAALIASWKAGTDRTGGWRQIRRAWEAPDGYLAEIDGSRLSIPAALASAAGTARWLRMGQDGVVEALLLPNGASRTSARQVTADGAEIIVPLPAAVANIG